jgi:hypothetical protein
MKNCKSCNIIKNKEYFSFHTGYKNNLHSRCKECVEKKRKEIYLNSKKEYLDKCRTYYKNNKEKILIQSKIRHERNKKNKADKLALNRIKNPETYTARQKIYYNNNIGLYNAKDAKRRAAKLQRTPKWLTKKQLKEIKIIYMVCRWLNAWKMEKFHVDHIVPLQGENSSGLHVPWNLQILTAKENFIKGNKFIWKVK